jgi:L-lactate dehydrogenase complex protein LldG
MSETKPAADQNRVLDDVRRALGRTSTVPPVPLQPFIEPTVKSDVGELIARFTEEATAVRARVYLMSDKLQFVADGAENSATAGIDKPKFAGRVGELISEICRATGATEVAVSDSGLIAKMDLQENLAAQGLSVFTPHLGSIDHGELVARLANCGAGLTAADYAIAETGTIVLTSDERNALLVSLLPPVHIALVRSAQIEASIDEVIKRIGNERTGRSDPGRSVTMITGPSRTSDVELVLSIGVHGPKELHVIILD